jgi:tRNA-specific 2-thiouridylase
VKRKKVVIGLSGGVDSSVAAALLVEQGYDVEGVYLECYNEPGCRTDEDKKDALQVAIKLDIRFQTLDFRKEYKEKVIEYFYAEYAAGRTPNPDVICNREIKFGIFYDWAMKAGFDYVATGHYCRISGDKLQRARDESKDQSYFLWQIPTDHLRHILFPLGEMLKSEVRARARELGLLTANKPDSMGICFIGEVNVRKLLKDRLGEKVGDVIMYPAGPGPAGLTGAVVGRHKGLWFSTIGSRGGWKLDPKKQTPQMPILYVIEKNSEKNKLVVGTREETLVREFRIQNLGFSVDGKLWVRIRNLGEFVGVDKVEDGVVRLKKKIFGVAEGQSAVFYDKNGGLVGGSIIV